LPFSINADKKADDFIKEALKKIEEIDAQKLYNIIGKEDIVIIDVREKIELAEGKIKGSIHIPRGTIEFRIEEIVKDKNKKIITYCKKGGRGVLAAATLKEMGYKNVFNLKGGIVAWMAAGLPVEKE